MQRNYLILVSDSYPYDAAAEQTFLAPELEYLAQSFQVIVVPGRCDGVRSELPAGVAVDESYAAIRCSNSHIAQRVLRAASSPRLYKELRKRPSVLLQPLSLKRLVAFIDMVEVTKHWVCDFISKHKLDPNACIFYTFWFDASSMGIGLARSCADSLVIVSRAHGNDLYEERHAHNYIPCREQAIQFADGLFSDSDAGRDYLASKYPRYATRCETARLGVKDPGFTSAKSTDDVLRIVSCSFIVPVKRVDLILQGIECAARRRPDMQFEWHHFGTGPMREAIEEQSKRAPSNLRCHLPGYLSVEHLMQHYRQNPVDLFINASVTEGTPVAVMEAISCGIPVVATAVGGNPEIVTERNGLLLSANPSPDEIAATILATVDDPAWMRKRQGSRAAWQERYDSDQNFQAFVARLAAIRAQRGVKS